MAYRHEARRRSRCCHRGRPWDWPGDRGGACQGRRQGRLARSNGQGDRRRRRGNRRRRGRRKRFRGRCGRPRFGHEGVRRDRARSWASQPARQQRRRVRRDRADLGGRTRLLVARHRGQRPRDLQLLSRCATGDDGAASWPHHQHDRRRDRRLVPERLRLCDQQGWPAPFHRMRLRYASRQRRHGLCDGPRPGADRNDRASARERRRQELSPEYPAPL